MLTPNTVLQNRYCIIRQLGQGGMGTVYEAKALRLNTTVALKETHFTDQQLRKQFEREAQLLAGLRHPALPRVIDHFDEGDGLFLVMDFVAGEDLWAMLQKKGRAFSPNKVLKWADQLLDALDYLHNQESPIIHRDIKPQNLKLSDPKQITLLDFGLAKGFAGQVSRVTTSDSIFGYTLNYAPLEQIQGTGTEPRSDLYSLAATLYHLLTGNVPPDVLTRLTATSDGQPDPLRSANEINPLVTPGVAAMLNKAMSIGRNQRFATAAEMRERLIEADRSRLSTINQAATLIMPPKVTPSASSVDRLREQSKILLPPTSTKPPPARMPREAASTIAASPEAGRSRTPQLLAPQIQRPRKSNNRTSRRMGVAGSALLVIGTFLPMISVPSILTWSYMNLILMAPGSNIDGIALLLLGLGSLVLALTSRYRGLIATGVISFGVLAYDFYRIKSVFSKAASDAQRTLDLSIEWGFYVMVIAALLLIVGGATKKTDLS